MSVAVFPSLDGLTWPVTRTPVWNNHIQGAVGGRETRVSLSSIPRWRWALGYNFLRGYTPTVGNAFTEWQTLANFFNARQGSYDSFLYTDPNDYTIADTSPSTRQIFGTGTGARTQWQLVRTLITGGFEEPIYNVNGTAKIYKSDVLQTVATNYTISGTGLITFTVAPANGAVLTWSGSYYWRARFLDDSLDFSEFVRQIFDVKRVGFISILGS